MKLGSTIFSARISEAVARGQVDRVRLVEDYQQRLRRAFTLDDLRLKREVLEGLTQRLTPAASRVLLAARERTSALSGRLEAVSPQSVLSRGYSIVYSNERNVRSIADVSKGDPIQVRVSDGVISGKVL